MATRHVRGIGAIAIAIVAALLLLIPVGSAVVAQDVPRWEYTDVLVVFEQSENKYFAPAVHTEGERWDSIGSLLTEWGDEGWELVDVAPEATVVGNPYEGVIQPITYAVRWRAHFKRLTSETA